ncbi:MAG: PilN domain-containing protein [Patescibacteria group bacterium]
MINLLPPIDKERFRQEQVFRLIGIVGMVLVFSLISLFLLLLAIRIYLAGQIQTRELMIALQKKELARQELLKKNIQEKNSRVREMLSFYQNQSILSETFQEISALLPEGVYLTSLTYTPPLLVKEEATEGRGEKKETKNAKVFLAGFAPTRKEVLALRRNLKSKESFLGLYGPLSNWVIPTDVNFSFQFEIPSVKGQR